MPPTMRSCTRQDEPEILKIVNLAATVYRGVIPADRWHDPYMSADQLRAEIGAGVEFNCCVADAALIGVMGVESVRNVRLIRHAYVLPGQQGRGVGSALITRLRGSGDDRPILVGTWSGTRAIGFYQRHGFALAPTEAIAPLLRCYWDVPERQVETSVVLSSPALSTAQATRLIATA